MSKKIALFGRRITDKDIIHLQTVVQKLENENCEILICKFFLKLIKDKIQFHSDIKSISEDERIDGKVDFLLSIGGDGTILRSILLIKNSRIPVLGINLGRLGFLASVPKESINQAINDLIQNKYTISKRSLLNLEANTDCFGQNNFALNDICIHKKKPNSLLRIYVEIDGHKLNTYWSDGLIIATPTGSTAYSMSCGGPIVIPECNNFIITPIATHNLTVRPIVIPDDNEIVLRVEGREKEFFVGLDSRYKLLDSSVEFKIKKEKFTINLIQLENREFYKTIRTKLMWGLDVRTK